MNSLETLSRKQREHLAAALMEAKRRKIDTAPLIRPRRVTSKPVIWPPTPSIELRGGAAQMWADQSHELVLSGPAETGKTWAALYKVDTFLRSYPGAQATVARKVRATMYGSVLRTYDRVRAIKGNVTPYGGQQPEWYDYPNGSRLWVAGLDNPGKALSSERDLIFVNQAEELDLDDWQTLSTRVTGRGAVAPWTQLLGDCNPGAPKHWIKTRHGMTFYESRHEDNPTLYKDGEWTEQGRKTLSVLDNLTGVRYLRLRKGIWAGAEGMVYDEWDPAIHLITPFQIPAYWRHIRVFDFGYTNPFVCQWWAIDGDGRMYLYRELYMTQRTVEEHTPKIVVYSGRQHYEANVADHDAEDRATLERRGIRTLPARKDISVGVQAVQNRLKRAGDGKPRLFVFKNSLIEADETLRERNKPLCFEDEIVGYVWPKSADNKPVKEIPVQVDDHSMDTARYAVMYVDQPGSTTTQSNYLRG
jgi:PBSX family phage terminase large subunit